MWSVEAGEWYDDDRGDAADRFVGATIWMVSSPRVPLGLVGGGGGMESSGGERQGRGAG